VFFSISPACAPESSPHDARERLFADGDPDALRARGFYNFAFAQSVANILTPPAGGGRGGMSYQPPPTTKIGKIKNGFAAVVILGRLRCRRARPDLPDAVLGATQPHRMVHPTAQLGRALWN